MSYITKAAHTDECDDALRNRVVWGARVFGPLKLPIIRHTNNVGRAVVNGIHDANLKVQP